jgi:two-component system sensor histidine kinase KdpD
MAGIQSGDVKLTLEPRPLEESVHAALRSLGAVLAKHKVDVDIPPELPVAALDAGLMQRVFASLIGNVAKHTPAGTHVTISARPVEDAIQVSVEDNGPGLPKGREEAVFESFSRGDKNATRRGAGLGLAISRAIIEAHGGTIRAETGRKKGARFIITLPLTRK